MVAYSSGSQQDASGSSLSLLPVAAALQITLAMGFGVKALQVNFFGRNNTWSRILRTICALDIILCFTIAVFLFNFALFTVSYDYYTFVTFLVYLSFCVPHVQAAAPLPLSMMGT